MCSTLLSGHSPTRVDDTPQPAPSTRVEHFLRNYSVATSIQKKCGLVALGLFLVIGSTLLIGGLMSQPCKAAIDAVVGTAILGLIITAIYYCKKSIESHRAISLMRLLEALESLHNAEESASKTQLKGAMNQVLRNLKEAEWIKLAGSLHMNYGTYTAIPEPLRISIVEINPNFGEHYEQALKHLVEQHFTSLGEVPYEDYCSARASFNKNKDEFFEATKSWTKAAQWHLFLSDPMLEGEADPITWIKEVLEERTSMSLGVVLTAFQNATRLKANNCQVALAPRYCIPLSRTPTYFIITISSLLILSICLICCYVAQAHSPSPADSMGTIAIMDRVALMLGLGIGGYWVYHYTKTTLMREPIDILYENLAQYIVARTAAASAKGEEHEYIVKPAFSTDRITSGEWDTLLERMSSEYAMKLSTCANEQNCLAFFDLLFVDNPKRLVDLISKNRTLSHSFKEVARRWSQSQEK